MNKPVVGGVGGAGIGIGARVISGPTATAAQAAAQKQKSLTQRADTDINTILDNFSLLVKAARVSDAPFRNSQEAFQMEIHASRVVQAADSLLKLVSELKQTAVFSDFASLNEHVQQRVANFEQQSEETDRLLSTVAEQAATSLKELESHYYSSIYRTPKFKSIAMDSSVSIYVPWSFRDGDVLGDRDMFLVQVCTGAGIESLQISY